MQRVAQDWLVLALTGSAGALGLTTGLQFLPILLFSPIAGVIADRFSKRSVMMVTTVAMSTTAAILGVLAVTGLARPWHVYALAFAFGTAAAFDTPARQAFVNEMVGRDKLANAVALNSASFNLGRMIGPAVAGGVIALLGSGVGASGWVILLNSTTYPRRDRRPQADAQRGATRSHRSLGQGAASRRDCLRPVASRHHAGDGDPRLRSGTFGFNFQMTIVLMATEVYGKGAGEYGMLGSILAVGSLTGALIAAGERVEPAARRRGRNRLRSRHPRRRVDAHLPHVRSGPTGRRHHVDDVDDGGQLVRPDGG